MGSELLVHVIHSGWGMGNKRHLVLFELWLGWLCRCGLDEQVYESFFRIQTGAIVLVANVLVFSGAEFCRARAGLLWACGTVPAMGWALSSRWWQGDVSVSLLQGRGGFQSYMERNSGSPGKLCSAPVCREPPASPLPYCCEAQLLAMARWCFHEECCQPCLKNEGNMGPFLLFSL